MAPLSVERSIWIAAPRERVWQAIFEPEQAAQWFLPPALGAQLRRDESGKLSVLMGPMAVEVAMLEQIDPPRQLTSRGLPDNLIAAAYTLAEENGGTRVTSSIGEPQCEHNAQSRSTPFVGGCSISLSLFDGYVSQRTLRASVPDQSRKKFISRSARPSRSGLNSNGGMNNWIRRSSRPQWAPSLVSRWPNQ